MYGWISKDSILTLTTTAAAAVHMKNEGQRDGENNGMHWEKGRERERISIYYSKRIALGADAKG